MQPTSTITTTIMSQENYKDVFDDSPAPLGSPTLAKPQKSRTSSSSSSSSIFSTRTGATSISSSPSSTRLPKSRSTSTSSSTFSSESAATSTSSVSQVSNEEPCSRTTSRATVFCCNDAKKFTQDIDYPHENYTDFIKSALDSIPIAETEIDLTLIHHVVELNPTISTSFDDFSGHATQNEARYFALLKESGEYCEVSSEFFERFDDDNSKRGGRLYFTCAQHKRACQLGKYERHERVREAVGSKKQELSARQFAREKRRIMTRKMTYGHKEEIEELIGRKLKSIDDELIPKFEEADYLMARLSLYFKSLTSEHVAD